MDRVPKRVCHRTTVIRHEMDSPVDKKHWNFLYSVFHKDFVSVMGREPKFDDDWWIEPIEEGIAICYKDERILNLP